MPLRAILSRLLAALIITLLMPLLIAVAIFVGIPIYIYSLLDEWAIRRRFWRVHGQLGRDVLVVTSDSPTWSGYMRDVFLPRLKDRAVVINWSERSRWTRTVETRAFHAFAGKSDHTPIAIVFHPSKPPTCFRFYRAFLDFKHGKPQQLRQVEAELLEHLAAVDQARLGIQP